jgi:S-formylglutathione hydrolase FrmB
MQLHGLSDDCDSWLERSNLVRHVAGLPLVIALPDGGTSGYVNWKPSERLQKDRYEDLLIRDIPNHLRRHVNVTDGPWAIGGLSMGGYGAVKLGLKHHETFASVNSHSGALGFLQDPERAKNLSPEFRRIFGEDPSGGEEDPFAIVQKIDHGRIPALRLDCGTDDFLLDQNRAFHAKLQDLRIPHEYEEFPGGHNWEYWDEHVRQAIAFHKRNLGLE